MCETEWGGGWSSSAVGKATGSTADDTENVRWGAFMWMQTKVSGFGETETDATAVSGMPDLRTTYFFGSYLYTWRSDTISVRT